MSVFVSSQVWLADFSPASTKLIALCLADFADETGKCWPSNRTVASRCGIGVETVQAAINRMIEEGWIRREPQFRKDGSQASSVTRWNLMKLDRHSRKARAEVLAAAQAEREAADDAMGGEVFPGGEGEEIPGGRGNASGGGGGNFPGQGGKNNGGLYPSGNRQGTVREPLGEVSPGAGASGELALGRGGPAGGSEPVPPPVRGKGRPGRAQPDGGVMAPDVAKSARKPNPAWDALAELEGQAGGEVTSIGAGAIGRALKAIRAVCPMEPDALAAEIRRRSGNWGAVFGDDCRRTAMAVAKWWGRLGKAPTKIEAGATGSSGWEKFRAKRDAGLGQAGWDDRFAEETKIR